jgi:glycosyltransferase involved in cell wall biosynthesis
MTTDEHRTLLLLPWLELGGADTFNLDLARQLAERHGHRLTIALTLPSDNPWRPRFERYSRDIVPLYQVAPESQPAFARDLIRSRGIDTLLLSNSRLGYALLPYLRAHCPGLAALDFLHMEEERWRGGYPRASLDTARWLDQTVVSSEYLRAWMLARGGDPARIAVCYTGIDTNEWDPARFDRDALRRDLGVAPEERLILYAARLAPQKQPRLLAGVGRALREQGRRFTLLVAGDGPERPWLESFVRRERLGCVRLLGAVSSERVRELLAAADLFLLPSQYEGISLALYEAMAMGVPAVAADVGGQRELLTPECGVLVRRGPREQQEYLAALGMLLADTARRQTMGAAARRRVAADLQLDQMGDCMAQLLRQARENARRGPRLPTAAEADAAAAAAVALAREETLARRLWGHGDGPGEARPAVGALRAAKQALRPAYRWALARDERVGQIAVGLRNVLIRLLYRS